MSDGMGMIRFSANLVNSEGAHMSGDESQKKDVQESTPVNNESGRAVEIGSPDRTPQKQPATYRNPQKPIVPPSDGSQSSKKDTS